MLAEKAGRYGLTPVSAALDTAIGRLRDPGAPERFRQEMVRFLLSSNARHLANERLTRQFFDATERLVQEVKAAHEPRRARTTAPRARAQPDKNKRGVRKKAARHK